MAILVRGLVWFLLISIGAAWADEATPAQTASQAAWSAATKAAVSGPADVPLIDQAKLHLPDSLAFIPKAESNALMMAWGNSSSERLVGMIVPKAENESWAITIDFVADGFVKDEEAKTWNVDDLLQSIKDGTEAQNAERVKLGMPALDIVGWVQPPKYDSGSHRLAWSLKAVDRGAATDAVATINYNTYALGRDGYFEVNLMTDDRHVDADKAQAALVLAAISYNDGKRYSDFVAGTDRIAEYGLMALIGGVAAKKLGLIGMAGLFFAKFAKVIAIAVFAGGGTVLKLFRRKPKTEA